MRRDELARWVVHVRQLLRVVVWGKKADALGLVFEGDDDGEDVSPSKNLYHCKNLFILEAKFLTDLNLYFMPTLFFLY